MLSKLFVVLALLLALLGAGADASGICKSTDAPVGRCSVHIKVCGKISKLKWRYTGDAREPTTGATGHSSGHKSGNGAGEAAVADMFARHPELQAHCFGSELLSAVAALDLDLANMAWADEQ